jgi:acyl-CoA synthetase (AMP-forming)/AMP-acid ligase II
MVFGFGKSKPAETRAPVAPGVASAMPEQRGRGEPMMGLMQDWQLTVDKVLDHAVTAHGHREVVTRSVEGPIVRETYAELSLRAKRFSAALLEDGVQMGDRIATLAWNTARHMESWYGAMGIGAVLHTVNPRLFPEQIAWIVNDASDTHLLFDLTFLPIVQAIHAKCPTIRRYIVLTDDAHLPKDTGIPNLISYESYIDGKTSDVAWGEFPENTAAGLCYTSGTTGNPKGVLYSHRSNILHTLIGLQQDCLGTSVNDVVLPIVPMFHANAWGITFSAPAVGSKLVMPGAKMDGASVYELLDTEKVTFSAAVPTVWLMLKQYLEETGKQLPYLKRVVIGGSAVPEAILRTFEDKYDVQVYHAWGMTEMSPLGSMGSPVPEMEARGREATQKNKLKQGRAPFGVEYKVTDDDGKELARDGKSAGHLMVRGPAVAKAYFKGAGGQILDKDGWFDTGDVANLCPLGFMQITDRAKDVIKSGGEWISSIDIENFAVGHPAVANAAAIGLPHPKWDERPLLIVELKPGASATREEILGFLDGKIAKWWMPDDVAFTDKIPLGATGKINKLALREQFKGHRLPTVQAAE